jgi:ribosomal protein RSM22 (predicted rRNA methylase)
MAGPRTSLNALEQVDPEAAKARILEAARTYRGVRKDMAKALDVGDVTLWRMLRRLHVVEGDQSFTLAEVVDRIRLSVLAEGVRRGV